MNSYEGQVNEDGNPTNTFPVKVTVGKKPNTVDIAWEGLDTITVDVKGHYEDRLNEDDTLSRLAKDILSNNTYKAGDELWTAAGWGLWSVEPASFNGVECLKAEQGICSIIGMKSDVLGTLDLYFNYDSNGKIQVLGMNFNQY